MIRLLKISVIVTLTCVVAIVGVLSLRRTIEPSEAVRIMAPAGCAQPCWHGIQPGKTTLDQAEAILRADGIYTFETDGFDDPNQNTVSQLCWSSRKSSPTRVGCVWRKNSSDPNAPIDDIDIFYPDLRLGEVVQVLGEPIGIRLYQLVGTMDAYVYFQGNIQVNAGTIHNSTVYQMYLFTPHMRIVRLRYSRSDVLPCKLYPWNGFGTPVEDTWKCE